MSAYTENQIHELHEGADAVCSELRELVDRMTAGQWHTLTQPRAIDFLNHGVCRRLNVIRHAIERTFAVFPPERDAILERDELLDVQMYLHALVMNVFGVLDNLAWVFVLERGLDGQLGRKRIGLFIEATQEHLPATFRATLLAKDIQNWFSTYAKEYRDALAHRIPVYVPPFSVTDEASYRALDKAMAAALHEGDIAGYEALRAEQDGLCTVCAAFLHAIHEPDASHSIALHPQMIADGMTVAKLARDLGSTFAQPSH